MIGGLGQTGSPVDVCSRAACSASATHRIDWSNPRIHTDGREKTWLACDEHVAYLQSFLESRSFPVRVTGFDAGSDS